jgi:hypothetical protein
MDYQKVYESIIQKAKYENRIKHNGIYYENHHIIPKCLGGTDDKENLVLLTAKEHYVCHKLLTYIYKGNRKIVCALHRMSFNKNGNYNKSSRDYAYAIILYRTTPLSKETREKLSKSLIGNKHLCGHKHSIETKQKIGIKSRKRKYKHSIETKKKISNSHLGKKLSEETKRKIGEKSKNIKHSRDSIEKTRLKNKGRKRSNEFKIIMSKIGKTRIGERNSFFGKHHTEETKRKISETKKNKNNKVLVDN